MLGFAPDSQILQANAPGLASIEEPPQNNEEKHGQHGGPGSRTAVPCPNELDLHTIRPAADRNQHLASAFPRCGLHLSSSYFCSPRRIVKSTQSQIRRSRHLRGKKFWLGAPLQNV